MAAIRKGCTVEEGSLTDGLVAEDDHFEFEVIVIVLHLMKL